jgi:hypothetical protein
MLQGHSKIIQRLKTNSEAQGTEDIICKSSFLDFVHRLYFNEIITFRKLDLLPSSGKEEGQKP